MIDKPFQYWLKSVENDHHFIQKPVYTAAYIFIVTKYMSACRMFQTSVVQKNEVHFFIE